MDRRGKVRVLIVDDQAINRKVTRAALERLECHAVAASDGQEAITAALDDDFELILMDCHMPLLDGFQATRTLLERGCTASIVGLSASRDEQRCSAAGMVDSLEKPATLERLKATLLKHTSYIEVHTQRAEPSLESMGHSFEAFDYPGALAAVGGSETILKKVAEQYLAVEGEYFTQLRQAVDSGARQDVVRRAHTIKGASASIGGRRVCAVAGRIECREDDETASLSQLIAELEEVEGRFVQELSRFVRDEHR